MAREIEIDTHSLGADVDMMRTVLHRIESSLAGMYESVAALDRTWEGPANQVFVAQFAADEAAMQELCQIVDKLIGCMNYAKDEYNTCDAQVDSVVNSIRI